MVVGVGSRGADEHCRSGTTMNAKDKRERRAGHKPETSLGRAIAFILLSCPFVILSDRRERRISISPRAGEIPRRFAPQNDSLERLKAPKRLIGGDIHLPFLTSHVHDCARAPGVAGLPVGICSQGKTGVYWHLDATKSLAAS